MFALPQVVLKAVETGLLRKVCVTGRWLVWSQGFGCRGLGDWLQRRKALGGHCNMRQQISKLTGRWYKELRLSTFGV